MQYIVRTADRAFTDAIYDDFDDMITDWGDAILSGWNYFMVTFAD